MKPTDDRLCSTCGHVECVCVDPRPLWQLFPIAHAAQSIVLAAKWGIYRRGETRGA